MNDQQLIQMAAETSGLEFRSDYSGRGMYGDICVGIDADDMGAGALMLRDAMDWADDDEFRRLAQLLANHTTDSMGLGIILYWPHLAGWREEAEA